MRVIPSVTDTMEPTLRASVTDSKSSIRCLIRSLISVALMTISVSFVESVGRLRGQFVGNVLEPCAQRAIDHQVPGAHHRPADQARVDLAVQPYLALEALFERLSELFLLRLIERRRRGYRHVGNPSGAILEAVKEARDLGQVGQAVVGGERAHEVRALDLELRSGDAGHERGEFVRGDVRVAEQRLNARIRDHLRGRAQGLRPGGQTVTFARLLEGSTRVRSGDGELVRHGVGSDLRRELVEQVRVRARVDLATQELGGRPHRDAGHFPAQALLRAGGVELDLLLRGGDDARALGAGRALGLFHQLIGALLRVIDDLVGTLARLAHDSVGLAARLDQFLLALLRGRESLRDLARALVHRGEERWPDPLHHAQHQRGEHDHLHDEREIDVHRSISCLEPSAQQDCQWAACNVCSALTNGFANVKNSAKPMPIIAPASSSPATRTICTRRVGNSSGCRAEPSMKRPPRMPKPMAVPSAPMPKMMPTARTVMASMCAMPSIQSLLETNQTRKPVPPPQC